MSVSASRRCRPGHEGKKSSLTQVVYEEGLAPAGAVGTRPRGWGLGQAGIEEQVVEAIGAEGLQSLVCEVAHATQIRQFGGQHRDGVLVAVEAQPGKGRLRACHVPRPHDQPVRRALWTQEDLAGNLEALGSIAG